VTAVFDYRTDTVVLTSDTIAGILKGASATEASYFVESNASCKTYLLFRNPVGERRSAYLVLHFVACVPFVQLEKKISLKQADKVLKLWPNVEHTLAINGTICWKSIPLISRPT
jgi:hypothetical protein